MAEYYCHACDRQFAGPVDDTYGTYLFHGARTASVPRRRSAERS
jgi:hypothetical protein